MYQADEHRYDNGMQYQRCGRSGVLLPKVSLGMWHNFGSVDPYERSREIVRYAFDHGVTHLDLANNYGPVYGSAEETLGRLMDDDLRPYRDELFISTKAGYDMWPGPYGNWGSRKYLMASLDQSLRRMHLDYVDLFYSHRYDPNTQICSIVIAMTPTPHWRKPCRHWLTLSVVARRFMWAFPTGLWNLCFSASTICVATIPRCLSIRAS